MAKLSALVLNACLAIGLAGCTTQGDHMSVTYSTVEGVKLNRVSKLKRLVMLPPMYVIDGNVEKGWSPEAENKRVQEAAIRYLEDWRDYRVKPASGRHAESVVPTEELRVGLLGLLSSSGQTTKLPKETRAAINKHAMIYEADGVLVLGLRYEGLDARRWGATYGISLFTLSLGTIPYLASLGTHYTAAIFDANDGELVWYARNHGGSSDQPDAATYVGPFAFGTLPNALPQGMLEPR